MESARRFRALLSELGLQKDQAAQKLHVSLRTLHNWCSGVCEVPYATLKLLRLQRYMELPEPWTGWHFSRGHLITPEGRMIAHHEGAWWSLMVLRARSYDRLAQRLKAIEDAAEGPRLRGGAAAPQMAVAASGVPWENESCLSNSPSAKPPLSDAPDGNHGDNQTITVAKWYQTDTIRQSWQLPSGSRPKSKPSQKPTASGSESPSTPSLASRLTPIYNGQSLPLEVPRLRYSLHLNPLLRPLQSSPPDLAQSLGKSLSSQLHQGNHQNPSQFSALIRPRLNEPSLRTGTGEIPANSVKGVQPC